LDQKKIIFLGPAHPFRGGIASSSERLALELKNMGHDVEMLTFTTQYPEWLFPGKSQFTDAPAPVGLKITRAYSSINPFSWITLRKKIEQINPDLIVNRFWLPYIGLSAAHLMRPYSKHLNIQSLSIVDNLIPHQKMIGDNFCIKHYMKSHDKFIVMSSSVEKEINERFNNKQILTIPHPIYDNYGNAINKEKALSNLNLDPAFKYLLFFGFIKPYKGLDLLLDSIDKSYFLKHGIKLLIAGEVYGDPKKYYDIIKNRQLEDVIIFHNRYIHETDIKNYFSASDLVIQTYLTATQSGISQIALHFEKTVIVTDVGGLSEMVQDKRTGYVVEKNADAIMTAIKDFYENNREVQFNNDIKNLKENNTWAAFAEKMVKFVWTDA